MIWNVVAAVGAFIKLVLTIMGIIRDDKLRQEGAMQADLARRDATDAATREAQAIEDRPQPKSLQDSLKRLAILAFAAGLVACAPTMHIVADVDCPVLGKLLLMPDDAKQWLLAQPSPPPGVLEFTNAVGTHNDKVREICRKEPG